jgi:hypothetical protein
VALRGRVHALTDDNKAPLLLTRNPCI